jgi:hypothetical protein
MTAYSAYGVRLNSDLALPGLPPPRGDERTTVVARLEKPQLGREGGEVCADAEFQVHGRPLSLHVNGDLEVRWQDVCSFRISIRDALIRCERGRAGRDEDVQEWLLHYALPLLLVSEGHLQLLHGSAVQIGRQAVGFLAPSGGGKTTLAEYFLQRGHGFFTDEKLGVVARRQRVLAVPSTPFYRRGEANARWRAVTNFATSPAPLTALYVLVPADATATPAVTPVSAGEAAFVLTQRCEFQLPRSVRARLRLPSFPLTCFQACTALAAAVRVCRLVVPRDRMRLSDVYDAVVADVAGAA